MFLIDYISSIVTVILVVILYAIVVYRKPDVNWGSSTQGQTYKTALTAALKLQTTSEHVKNYAPQILVLTGKPWTRPPLVDFANLITKNNSLMIVGDVEPTSLKYKLRKGAEEEGKKWLEARKIKAFYSIVDDTTLENGVKHLIHVSGLGKLCPNIVMMGYKSDWQKCPTKDLTTYFKILHNAFSNRLAVAILRLPTGVDFTNITVLMPPTDISSVASSNMVSASNSFTDLRTISGMTRKQIMHVDSNLQLDSLDSNPSAVASQPAPMPKPKTMHQKVLTQNDINYLTTNGSTVPQETIEAMNVFQTKKPKGNIDVWWLYDDGGLTVLLPHIIAHRSSWANCKLRIFALANRTMDITVEEKNMANLLHKLRIEYTSLTMLQGVTDNPKPATVKMHEKLLSGFYEGQNADCFVSEEERNRLMGKTNIQLRLRELLLQHSKNAALVIMSLPMPRQDTVSAPLYMSWLEVLTRDMPPILLVRGNQSSVVTFYS